MPCRCKTPFACGSHVECPLGPLKGSRCNSGSLRERRHFGLRQRAGAKKVIQPDDGRLPFAERDHGCRDWGCGLGSRRIRWLRRRLCRCLRFCDATRARRVRPVGRRERLHARTTLAPDHNRTSRTSRPTLPAFWCRRGWPTWEGVTPRATIFGSRFCSKFLETGPMRRVIPFGRMDRSTDRGDAVPRGSRLCPQLCPRPLESLGQLAILGKGEQG